MKKKNCNLDTKGNLSKRWKLGIKREYINVGLMRHDLQALTKKTVKFTPKAAKHYTFVFTSVWLLLY